jgi:YesN/AraC family two-component response regulator
VDAGERGMSLLKKVCFDVVITDLGMRGMTGWEVASTIKKINPTLPVLVLTGWSDCVLSKEAGQIGIDMVLSKPIKKDNLIRALAEIVKLKAEPLRKLNTYSLESAGDKTIICQRDRLDQ